MKLFNNAFSISFSVINRNMRCIETELSESVIELESGINRNMRCIETTETKTNILGETSINRNMRCIETLK